MKTARFIVPTNDSKDKEWDHIHIAYYDMETSKLGEKSAFQLISRTQEEKDLASSFTIEPKEYL